MSGAVEFVETRVFTQRITQLASDDELRVLQAELIANPEKGSLIEGTGGLRKVRMAVEGSGKSGGVRVIYFLLHAEKVYLVYAYRKVKQDTLSDKEKAQLRQVVKMIRNEG